MHILLTNDDGVEAPGLRALLSRVRSLGRVTVVAPDREQSGIGHSVTLDRPIHCRRLPAEGTITRYAADATPVDCVKLAVSELARPPIDLVLSGINAGGNAGVNVLYSGTVAAAIEAAMCGLPAAAISLPGVYVSREEMPFDRAADVAVSLIEELLRADLIGPAPLNINIPPLNLNRRWPLGWRVVRQSLAAWNDQYVDADVPDAYRILRDESRRETEPDTDLCQLSQGYVTVTPLTFDLTDREALAALRRAAETVAEEA